MHYYTTPLYLLLWLAKKLYSDRQHFVLLKTLWPPPHCTPSLNEKKKKGSKTLGTSAQGLTMTIPPALTMLPETGRVTVTVPWPLFVVLVLAPPACTIWAPARLAAGIVIIPANRLSSQSLFNMTTRQSSHSRRQTEEAGESRAYPAAKRCRPHWRADRRWSVRQQSVPPVGPAHWSAAPVRPHIRKENAQ